jgi:hypothetical protein
MFRGSIARRSRIDYCLVILLFTLGLTSPPSAIATDLPTDPVTLSSSSFASIYMDAPFVQASYASTDNVATNVVTENFDNLLPPLTDGNCPQNIAVGTVSPTSACLLYANDPNFGGATTSSSEPVDIGAHSTYAAVHDGDPLTITFPSAKKYVGFWWSAGSVGNNVSFLDESGTVVAELNANDIYNKVSAETIIALSGSQYLSSRYLGHPGDLNTDESGYSVRYDSEEPFVYIHVISPTGINAIRLSAPGNGFEFDNLTTADGAPNVNQRLVLVRDIFATQSLPTPSPNPSYEFQGWYSDSALENYIGMPGDPYYPDSTSVTIYPRWSFLFDPTYSDIAPNTGPIGTWVNLKGNQISHSQGDYGWQTVFIRTFEGETLTRDWMEVDPQNIRDHYGNESIDVKIPDNLPAGTTSVTFHIDACSQLHPALGCVSREKNDAVFNIGAPVAKTLTVGAISSAIQATVASTSTYSVSTQNIFDGETASITWYTSAAGETSTSAPTGISISATNVLGNAETLTVVAGTNTIAGPYYFKVITDGTESVIKTLVIGTAPNSDNGGGNNGGGNNGGGNDVVIEIQLTKTDTVVVAQSQVPTKAPDRKIIISKSATKNVNSISPKVVVQQPSISIGTSTIAIRGATQGQRIRVTVVGKEGLAQVMVPDSDGDFSALVNKNVKSTVKIEITPTSTPTLKKKAKIAIDGAKKNQRVRVIVSK